MEFNNIISTIQIITTILAVFTIPTIGVWMKYEISESEKRMRRENKEEFPSKESLCFLAETVKDLTEEVRELVRLQRDYRSEFYDSEHNRRKTDKR